MSHASAAAAQFRIGLQCVDHHVEIVKPDDPFELETGAFLAQPDKVCLDPANNRKANDHAITASQVASIVDHETMRRDIRDVQVHITTIMVFCDNRIIHRMARCATLIGYRKLCTD